MLGCGRVVFGIAAHGEQPAMHLRMQRLQAAIHHLGKPGVLGDVLDRDAGLLQGDRRAAGRQDLDAGCGQRLAELDDAGLVGDRDQGAADF